MAHYNILVVSNSKEDRGEAAEIFIEDRVLEAGMNAHLAKPIEPELL